METKITPATATATTKKQDDKEIERMVVAQAKAGSTNAIEQQAGQENELDERDSKCAKGNP